MGFPAHNGCMAGHLQEALEKLLDEHDQRQRTEVAREQRARDDEATFLARFAELRRGVIRPVFEAAGQLLAARGHRCTITESEFLSGEGGRISEAGISMRIAPSGIKAALHEDRSAL